MSIVLAVFLLSFGSVSDGQFEGGEASTAASAPPDEEDDDEEDDVEDDVVPEDPEDPEEDDDELEALPSAAPSTSWLSAPEHPTITKSAKACR